MKSLVSLTAAGFSPPSVRTVNVVDAPNDPLASARGYQQSLRTHYAKSKIKRAKTTDARESLIVTPASNPCQRSRGEI
jgi:hypothetical protein